MRTTKTFEVTVGAYGNANANANAKDSFSMEAGETVRIRGIYSPEDASMDFGLIDSAGVFHYVNVKDGSIDQTFKISESVLIDLELGTILDRQLKFLDL